MDVSFSSRFVCHRSIQQSTSFTCSFFHYTYHECDKTKKDNYGENWKFSETTSGYSNRERSQRCPRCAKGLTELSLGAPRSHHCAPSSRRDARTGPAYTSATNIREFIWSYLPIFMSSYDIYEFIWSYLPLFMSSYDHTYRYLWVHMTFMSSFENTDRYLWVHMIFMSSYNHTDRYLCVHMIIPNNICAWVHNLQSELTHYQGHVDYDVVRL